MFQFLIGRLDTVQLRLHFHHKYRFQFLIGRLDTGNLLDRSLADFWRFQFLIGRLDTCLAEYREKRKTAVSIPHR